MEQLAKEGYEARDRDFNTRLDVKDRVLDYLESAFGPDTAQRMIASGFPIYPYSVAFKKAGEPRIFTVTLDPSGLLLGWSCGFEDDDEGDSLDLEHARTIALRAISDRLGMDTTTLAIKAASTKILDKRQDHYFTWERYLSFQPELREEMSVHLAGSRIASASRALIVPPAEARASRVKSAPRDALTAIGYALIAAGSVIAFLFFLNRLNDRDVLLGRVLAMAAVAFACLAGADLLRPSGYFLDWDPLQPKGISYAGTAVWNMAGYLQLMILLLAFIGAGDAIDRREGSGRGESLWALCRGRLSDAKVAAASMRGFLIGLCCGGVLTLSISTIRWLTQGSVSIQPRGFFFYGINSTSPTFSILLFFLFVALTEELGYRFFGGAWLMKKTGNKFIAIALPAVIYGLAHTPFDFLPPAEPFWGRAVALTLVSCVWGWAFLRFDALTVILSHYTADLFIFNWPRLGSGRPELIAAAVATVAVPLLPAALLLIRTMSGGRHTRRIAVQPREGGHS